MFSDTQDLHPYLRGRQAHSAPAPQTSYSTEAAKLCIFSLHSAAPTKPAHKLPMGNEHAVSQQRKRHSTMFINMVPFVKLNARAEVLCSTSKYTARII